MGKGYGAGAGPTGSTRRGGGPGPGTVAGMPADDRREVVERVLRWYDVHARDLPWRRPGVGAWEVMVSEFMLQQTPVARVLEPWRQWIARWPTPSDLAAAPAGDAVRAWGRLGYPRRALRLHRAAEAITEHHDGQVPTDLVDLLALPGVGSYTAAAIASFAYGQRHVVLDTNVRRVLARVASGVGTPAARRDGGRDPAWPPSSCRRRRPGRPAGRSRRWSWARWSARPVRPPANAARSRTGARGVGQGDRAVESPRRRQTYEGTDRQCRGVLLAVLRSSDVLVARLELDAAWPDAAQRDRALASLIVDGLVVGDDARGYALPG